MMDKKKIREFNEKPIEEIIEPLQKTHEIVKRLFYLKETGRWKEKPGYENKSFEEFLEGACGMELKDYEFLQWLYSKA